MAYEIHLKDHVGNQMGIGKVHTVENIDLNVSGFIGVDSYYLPVSNILFVKIVS